MWRCIFRTGAGRKTEFGQIRQKRRKYSIAVLDTFWSAYKLVVLTIAAVFWVTEVKGASHCIFQYRLIVTCMHKNKTRGCIILGLFCDLSFQQFLLQYLKAMCLDYLLVNWKSQQFPLLGLSRNLSYNHQLSMLFLTSSIQYNSNTVYIRSTPYLAVFAQRSALSWGSSMSSSAAGPLGMIA